MEDIKVTIASVSSNEDGPVIQARFDHFDGNSELRTYYLKEGQTIEDIKPRIKADLDTITAAKVKVNDFKSLEGTEVDLEGVKSQKVIDAEVEAQKEQDKKDAEEARAQKVAEENAVQAEVRSVDKGVKVN